MKKQDIHLDDIKRIVFGEAPPLFLLETLIRSVIIYIFLLFVVRWLGKRMSGQLSIMEMAVMLTLGAIVAVGMQVPDRGILLSALVLLSTLVFQRGLGWLGFKNAKIERVVQGELSILVKDGILELSEMEHCRISKQQLFAQLRNKNIYNLGKVKRVYLEASGLFSIFLANTSKPGLPLFPPDDKSLLAQQTNIDLFACLNCGFVSKKSEENEPCSDCGHNDWIAAINQ